MSCIYYYIFFIVLFVFYILYDTNDAHLLTSNEARKRLQNNEIHHIIDVRTPQEYNEGHKIGSIHIPIQSFTEDIFNVFDKKETLLVYCRTGKRAKKGVELLQSYGFTNLFYIQDTYKSLQ